MALIDKDAISERWFRAQPTHRLDLAPEVDDAKVHFTPLPEAVKSPYGPIW